MQPDSAANPRGIPRHVAIIMDGNGRWAQRRHLPRTAGHRAGVESVRRAVEGCGRRGVEVLTLFAFSSENWQRPQEEVGILMELFVSVLQRESRKLHENRVRLRVIGERTAFSAQLQGLMGEAEELTRDNDGLNLVIAANYGGRWDIAQAARRLVVDVECGRAAPEDIERTLPRYLSIADLPEPDLFIRTGGEQRVSNFLLWQLAYTELYFTETLWPDFDDKALEHAIADYAKRQRRFGRIAEQVDRSESSLGNG